jgi:predicted metalloprotease with PDZ domain
LVLDNQWKIEDAVAEKIISDILLKYEDYFGAIPEKSLNIVNFRFPKDVGFERWRAETFGGNILIMSAPTTFESQMRQRFQEQLRHELFHLWMPNNLTLTGDYAGFYEGFAQYTALRAGVELNQISFRDFLNTLEQSYNLANRRSQPISLIEASKNRWLSENSSVYAKGLAVAFLLDTALLKQSGGKKDLIFLLGEIYKKHKKPNKQENGNTAILKFFESYPSLSPIIKEYVEGAEKLNFGKYLPQTGIEIQPAGRNIKLRVKDDLSGREKDFLDKLGYNNWRKFLSK